MHPDAKKDSKSDTKFWRLLDSGALNQPAEAEHEGSKVHSPYTPQYGTTGQTMNYRSSGAGALAV